MKIAYIWHGNPFHEDGILKKVRSQADAWAASGASVQTFCLTSVNRSCASISPHLVGNTIVYRNPLLGQIVATMRLARKVRRWQPDVVYIRYTPLFPPPIGLLRTIPTVIEINSDDRAEYARKAYIKSVLNRLNRRILFAEAVGFACVTPELAAGVVSNRPNVKRAVITNGVSLAAGSTLPPAANDRPRLVYMGASAPWHGVDKMIRMAEMLPQFDFDFVGADFPSGRELPSNVAVHGFCRPDQYRAILGASDVALGTLGLHRLGMKQAAPLKTREYLLWGLPVIIGYDDPDFSDHPWFTLNLPNVESNVTDSVERIRGYVEFAAGRRVPRNAIADRVDIAKKESDRVAFLEEVVAGSGASRRPRGQRRSVRR